MGRVFWLYGGMVLCVLGGFAFVFVTPWLGVPLAVVGLLWDVAWTP